MTAQTDFEKGKKLFDEKQFLQAITFFEKDLLKDNNNFRTIEIIGDSYGQLKKWDKALFYYQKLTVIKPQEANYWYKYGGVLGMKARDANKFAALGMIPEVKSAFEKTIAINPKHLEARYALIELYLQLPGIVGGSERKARKYADEIATISTIDGYFAKGRIEEYFDNFAKAEIQYKKAYDFGKSKTAFQKLYDLYKKNSKSSAKAIALKQEFESK